MINISVQSLEQILRASTISAEKKVYFQQVVKEFINLLISQMYTVEREGKKIISTTYNNPQSNFSLYHNIYQRLLDKGGATKQEYFQIFLNTLSDIWMIQAYSKLTKIRENEYSTNEMDYFINYYTLALTKGINSDLKDFGWGNTFWASLLSSNRLGTESINQHYFVYCSRLFYFTILVRNEAVSISSQYIIYELCKFPITDKLYFYNPEQNHETEQKTIQFGKDETIKVLLAQVQQLTSTNKELVETNTKLTQKLIATTNTDTLPFSTNFPLLNNFKLDYLLNDKDIKFKFDMLLSKLFENQYIEFKDNCYVWNKNHNHKEFAYFILLFRKYNLWSPLHKDHIPWEQATKLFSSSFIINTLKNTYNKQKREITNQNQSEPTYLPTISQQKSLDAIFNYAFNYTK